MKKLFLLLLLVPIVSFSQNEELDPEYQEEAYEEEAIPKHSNPLKYKGLVSPVLEGNQLIVYTASGNYELSRTTINGNSEVRCSGENFFVIQDNTTRSAIVYDQLCKEIGRVQLKLSENVAFILWDGDQYNDTSFDFKIINREINMTKYYLKDGKYLYKKLIDENKDFED